MLKRKKSYYTSVGRMLSRITVILLIVLIGFVIVTVFFETPLCFSQVSIQPIKMYYETYYGELPVTWERSPPPLIKMYGYPSPNWTVSELTLKMDSPLNKSNIRFEIEYQNLSYSPIGWHLITKGEGVLNMTEVYDYANSNAPDTLITFPAFENGSHYFWRDIIELPDGSFARSIPSKTLLTRTSFDIWEGELLLDGSKTTVERENRTFASVTVSSLVIEIKIPNNFQIQNVENMNISPDSNGYLITETIGSGETFHLILKDSNLEPIKNMMSIFSGFGIPSLIIGVFISEWIGKKKKVKRRKRK